LRYRSSFSCLVEQAALIAPVAWDVVDEERGKDESPFILNSEILPAHSLELLLRLYDVYIAQLGQSRNAGNALRK
jgi:hypothetical protein